MMLRCSNQRDRHALVGAEAGAAEWVIFDLARGGSAHRSHPAGKFGHGALRPLGSERAGIFVPAVLPVRNIARVVASEPAPEADTDQPFGAGPWRHVSAPGRPARDLLIDPLMETHLPPHEPGPSSKPTLSMSSLPSCAAKRCLSEIESALKSSQDTLSVKMMRTEFRFLLLRLFEERS